MLGLVGVTFLTLSVGAVVGYHHDNLRKQRGEQIEEQTKGVLKYIPSSLPFLDRGYLESSVTPKEIYCSKILKRTSYFTHCCTITFFEFPEIPVSLWEAAPTLEEQTVDDLIAACEEKPKLCNNRNVQILEQLSRAQKTQQQVYLTIIPPIDSSDSLYMRSIDPTSNF